MPSHIPHCIRCGICCAATLACFHIYELAQVLHRHADDAGFWDVWFELHDPSVANRWRQFVSLSRRAGSRAGCPEAAREETERLPADVKRWLATYSWSPIAGLFRPNKDELWLHWALPQSGRDRAAMLRRRLLPERLPGPFGATHVPESQITWRMRVRSRASYLKYLASRLSHHARALPPTLWSASAMVRRRAGTRAGILAASGFRRLLRLRNVRLLLPLQSVSAEARFPREFPRADVRSHDRSEHRGFHPVGVCDPAVRHAEDADGLVHASGRAVGVTRGGYFRAGVTGSGRRSRVWPSRCGRWHWRR